jgi:hypothetical protein
VASLEVAAPSAWAALPVPVSEEALAREEARGVSEAVRALPPEEAPPDRAVPVQVELREARVREERREARAESAE